MKKNAHSTVAGDKTLADFVSMTSKGRTVGEERTCPFGDEMAQLSKIAKEAGALRALYAEEIEGLKSKGRKRQRRRRLGGAAIIVCLVASGLGVSFGWRDVAAKSGMPVVVSLSDGSSIYLDAGARMEIPLAPWRRGARLNVGDAVFDIVHDQSRPFVLQTKQATFTDMGTRFLVSARENEAQLAVFEGEVEVGSATGHRMWLKAGQAAKAGPLGISNMVAPEESVASAWRQGRLVFRDTPLAEAVISLSRYRERPVRLADDGLRQLKISGSFRIDDIDGALKILEKAMPLRIVEKEGWSEIQPVGVKK